MNTNDNQYKITKCPSCGKSITDINGVPDRCPYCGIAIETNYNKKSTKFKINKKLFIYLVTIVILIISFGKTVINNNKLLEKYNNVNDNYNDILEKYDALLTDYESNLSKIEYYEDVIDELREQQDTIDKLNERISELEDKYNNLKTKYTKLKESSGTSAVTQSNGYNSRTIENNDDIGETVWISATGSKYHNKPDCGNMNPDNATEISLSSSEAKGYAACKKCY